MYKCVIQQAKAVCDWGVNGVILEMKVKLKCFTIPPTLQAVQTHRSSEELNLGATKKLMYWLHIDRC